MTIEWMSGSAFRDAFDEHYRASRVALDQELATDLGADAIRDRVGAAGVSNPDDDGDEPGPCIRWYGRAGSTLFFLTAYESKEFSILTTRRASQGYPWSVLSEFTELSWFLSRATWLSGLTDDLAQTAVCRIDRWEIRRQIYSCASAVEAASLRDLFNTTGGDAVFFVCEPDPADSHWVIFGSDGVTPHGRYSRRESAEDVARGLSERTSSEVRVVEQPSKRLSAVFHRGRRLLQGRD